MSVTIPSLDPVTDILDTDKIMVTQQSGQTYTIDGASFNKRNQAVIANSTTLTGAPLKTGNIVRAYFTADITGVNTTTGLVLNYNNSNKNVKVPKDGALVNFTAQNMGGSPTVYKYLQAYTTLELLYDGTNFVIQNNPVVISSSDYTIYADGLKRIDVVTIDDKNIVTSNAVAQKLKVTSGDGVANSQYVATGSIKWYKYGRIVVCKTIGIRTTSVVAGGTLITGLPEPATSQEVVLYNSTENKAVLGIIRTAGFGNSTGWANNVNYYGTFTYFAAS